MEQTAFAEQRDDLLQSIERDQGDVRTAVQELASAARSTLDIGERIKALPLTWVLGGFFIGMWLGSHRASAAVAGQRRS